MASDAPPLEFRAVDRSLFARHYRLLSVIGGVAFGIFAWLLNGAQASIVSAILIVIVGTGFGAGMWAVGRASTREH